MSIDTAVEETRKLGDGVAVCWGRSRWVIVIRIDSKAHALPNGGRYTSMERVTTLAYNSPSEAVVLAKRMASRSALPVAFLDDVKAYAERERASLLERVDERGRW